MIAIKISTNTSKVESKLIELDNQINKMAPELAEAMAKEVKKNAKQILGAVFHPGGNLANSIKYWEGTGKNHYVVGPTGSTRRYAKYINKGFSPHVIPIEYVEQHRGSPGQKGQYVDQPQGWVMSMPKPGAFGFMNRALMHGEKSFDRLANKLIRKHIK